MKGFITVKHQHHIISGIIVCLAFAIAIFAFTRTQKIIVVINEIAFQQSDGRDWIELYNPNNYNITLSGLYLSDDKDDLQRFKFKRNFIVPAGGFAVIYGDRDSAETPYFSTNFNIRSGETIYLTAGNGETIIDSLKIPRGEYTEDITLGRYPDGADRVEELAQATPLSPNIVKEER